MDVARFVANHFKPDSDDVRDSPALDIAAQLHVAGAKVVVHDPKGIEPARKRFPMLEYAQEVTNAVKDARRAGKNVVVLAWEGTLHPALAEAANAHASIDSLRKLIGRELH